MWPSVRTAVEQFAEENRLNVHAADAMAFWWIDPKNSENNKISKLSPQVFQTPSIYSLVKNIPMKEIGDEVLSSHFFDYINVTLPESLILIEPKDTISLSKIGAAMEPLGKVFLIDCFEVLGNNIYANYDTHPFHQCLSNIKQQNLTKTIIPIQMFSRQAAHCINIKSSMIYINLSDYFDRVIEHLTVWKDHLTPEGTLCGNLGGDEKIREEISRFADLSGFILTVKGSGFWILKHP